MSRKIRVLLTHWDQVNEDHPQLSDAVRMQMAIDLYNMDHPNDEADMSDLIDALEYGSD